MQTTRDLDGRRMSSLEGQDIASKMLQGKTHTTSRPEGGVSVIDKSTGQELGVISDGLAVRLGLAGARPQASGGAPISPVGAGAGSPVAAMAGLNQNMTGQPIQRSQ